MSNKADKIIPDYAPGKPTAAQKRNRWLTLGGLVTASVAAAAVRLATAQPVPAPSPAGGLRPPPQTPTTQPAALRGDVRTPSTMPSTQDCKP